MARNRRERAAKRNVARQKLNKQRLAAGLEALEDARERPRTVRYKPMIDRYLSRGQINESQHEAGRKFRDDWIGMGNVLSSGRVCAQSWEILGAGYSDPTPYQIDCKKRVDAAILGVGEFLSSVLINVCLFDFAASEWAATFGKRPTNDGIACLRLALDGLKAHYEGPSRRRPAARRAVDPAELQLAS